MFNQKWNQLKLIQVSIGSQKGAFKRNDRMYLDWIPRKDWTECYFSENWKSFF